MNGFIIVGIILVIAIVILIMKKRRDNQQRFGGYSTPTENTGGLFARAKAGLSKLGNCCKKTVGLGGA